MNDIVPCSLDDEQKKRISDYIKNNGITKDSILTYSSVFPDRALRNLVESEAIFSVTQ